MGHCYCRHVQHCELTVVIVDNYHVQHSKCIIVINVVIMFTTVNGQYNYVQWIIKWHFVQHCECIVGIIDTMFNTVHGKKPDHSYHCRHSVLRCEWNVVTRVATLVL